MSLLEGELESAVEMRAALDAGDVTATELVERSVERAAAWQPAINAFSQLWLEGCLAEAHRATRGPDAGRTDPWGLRSVPLAVKDLYDVAGHRSTGCSRAYWDNVAREDAEIITRMRGAGLIMVGKTNQHELAAGGTNIPSACGRTGNPWDPERITGGSSGGSGAAVAAGITPLALGSDTGGSIRIPSAMCGTFGLKPTTGRLPTAGLMPLAPSMDCPGPIASTVADLELLYRAMAGRPAGEDPRIEEVPFRVAIPNGFFADAVHDEVVRTVTEAGRVFEGAGAIVEPIDGTGIEDARQAWMLVCTPEFAAAHPLAWEHKELLHPQVAEWLDLGETITAEAQASAAKRRREITQWFDHRLERFDALLIPTTPYPAPRADQTVVDLGSAGSVDVNLVGPGWMTCSVNLAGLPAINLPAGRSSEGLPIGVSLVGPRNAEVALLGLARLWERATGYRPQQPSLPGG